MHGVSALSRWRRVVSFRLHNNCVSNIPSWQFAASVISSASDATTGGYPMPATAQPLSPMLCSPPTHKFLRTSNWQLASLIPLYQTTVSRACRLTQHRQKRKEKEDLFQSRFISAMQKRMRN